jgi:VWFA-related protein
MPRRTRFTPTLAVMLATAVSVAVLRGQAPQQPTFRSAIAVVPVDVRVLDRSGKPVTDLKQEDFTILEKGVRQEIRHFEVQAFDAGEAKSGKLAIRETALSLKSQNNRIFLILLGRGRLQEPSKGVDAVIRLVREQLFPQDQVAILSYNRATDFTTDHQAIIRVLERFRDLHEEIDMKVKQQMTGMAAIYGSKRLQKQVQSKIDQIFDAPGGVPARRVQPGVADSKLTDDTRRQTDALIKAQEEDARKALGGGSVYSTMDELDSKLFADMPLDEFMSVTSDTLEDLTNLAAGIEFLRHLDGEKHLLFVTEHGVQLTRTDQEEHLAAMANDARVAIDTFQTGGLEPQVGGVPTSHLDETMAFGTLRRFASDTGGVSSIADPGRPLDRLDAATRSGYLLGYYPSNGNLDGQYREITVKVNRPDTTVLFRHGYYARADIGSFDRRGFITNQRILAAARADRSVDDIRVKGDATYVRGADGRNSVRVLIKVNPARLALPVVNGLHAGQIDVALFAFDAYGKTVAADIQRIDVNVGEDVYQKIVKDGVPYDRTMPVPSGPKIVRVVIYDFHADLLGSTDLYVKF